jgi:hypothetical protein
LGTSSTIGIIIIGIIALVIIIGITIFLIKVIAPLFVGLIILVIIIGAGF